MLQLPAIDDTDTVACGAKKKWRLIQHVCRQLLTQSLTQTLSHSFTCFIFCSLNHAGVQLTLTDWIGFSIWRIVAVDFVLAYVWLFLSAARCVVGKHEKTIYKL